MASVRTGCFKSYVIDHEGQEQVLGFHLPGEIIGLDAIHSCKHVANVVALDTSAVCGLTFDTVSSMARHMPELQNELFRVMSQRISELETIAGDLSADERIAMFLLSLSDRFSRRGYSDKEFILAMSRRDIASYLRLATETVSRVLARFLGDGPWALFDDQDVLLAVYESFRTDQANVPEVVRCGVGQLAGCIEGNVFDSDFQTPCDLCRHAWRHTLRIARIRFAGNQQEVG